ncbi:MAG TPA: EpsI family protein [Vicinamibacterales bacterium]|nr:EpsI family protein [Vicinamibacterales bacterium]
MLPRALAVAVIVVLAGTWAGTSVRSEAPSARQSLGQLPLRLGSWEGVDAAPFPDDVVAQLGVDDYIHRLYRHGKTPTNTEPAAVGSAALDEVSADQAAADQAAGDKPAANQAAVKQARAHQAGAVQVGTGQGGVEQAALSIDPTASAPVSVYIGYYHSQRQGDAIHSPQNCLPGAGWRAVGSGLATVTANGAAVRVNEYVIAKGLERQVVLYWYQGRGRVVANEYTNKALLMLDAARLGRTNGGLVRLIAPVLTTVDAARTGLTDFAAALLPHLGDYLP